MIKLSFRHCTTTILDKKFGLRRTFSSQLLDQWLTDEQPITEAEMVNLETHQEDLRINYDAWNKQELAINFIGPVISKIRFWEPYRYNFFAGRHISIQLDSLMDTEKVELGGEPDGMIATGYREPEVPIFAFTEYKKEVDSSGDPAGQTVAAMLVAQQLNQQEIPIYGCYVIGQNWYFVVLEGKHYTISQSYSAIDDDLFTIFRILKSLKAVVLAYTAQI
ncbi:MAG: hypothetical protein AAF639_24795 [Chloroflexota bacterium]